MHQNLNKIGGLHERRQIISVKSGFSEGLIKLKVHSKGYIKYIFYLNLLRKLDSRVLIRFLYVYQIIPWTNILNEEPLQIIS